MNFSKIFIFDLDGVLIDSREIHYEALNDALQSIAGIKIERNDHIARYDGLGTTTKLKMLTQEKGLDPSLYQKIWEKKQEETIRIIKLYTLSPKLIEIFSYLKKRGWKIAVASNAIRNTVKIALLKLGILEYVDIYLSNEDVERNKPAPDIYWEAMKKLNAVPSTTIILEDSPVGRKGALETGALLCPIENPDDLTLDKIKSYITKMENKPQVKIPYRNKNLLVVIPMAGRGSRFSEVGYTFPKPLIEIRGKPMIQVVVDNLNVVPGKFLFLVQKDHYEKYDLQNVLRRICPEESEVEIVQINGITEGAACTVLKAKEAISSWTGPMLLANSDQFVEWDSNQSLYVLSNPRLDGGLLSFKSTHPKWSYAKLGENGFVSAVAEKKVISDLATVGIYYWSQASDFVKYAEQMIEKDIRTNGEFYICPIYNEMIQEGNCIKTVMVNKMWGLGDPSSLEDFLKNYKGET